jgi:hypothetical protein
MNEPGLYLLLADIVLFAHFLVVAFIVVGFLLILWGRYRGWRWIHDPVFRGVHLGAIAIVAAQAWLGRLCALTTLESSLREKAGQAVYTETFVQHWLHELLFFDTAAWVFTTLYSIFGALVFVAWVADRKGKTDA